MRDLYLLRFFITVAGSAFGVYYILNFIEPNIFWAIFLCLLAIYLLGSTFGVLFLAVNYMFRDRRRFFASKKSLRKGLVTGIILAIIFILTFTITRFFT